MYLHQKIVVTLVVKFNYLTILLAKLNNFI